MIAATRATVPLLGTRTFALANGLHVIVHTERAAPAIAVSLTYRVGSQDESPAESGFAHLLEHLMSHGTAHLAPGEMNELVARSGGTCNAFTMRGNTTYHSLIPSGALHALLWAEAERMDTLEIDAHALAVEQRVILEEMRWRYTNGSGAVDLRLGEAAFRRFENRHPTIGDVDVIGGARVVDVEAFYRTHYAPNNAVLALAGDIDVDEARPIVDSCFASLPSRIITPRPDLAEPSLDADVRTMVDEPLAKVPTLAIGWRAPDRRHPDYWAMMLIAEILRGGENSPLHQIAVKDAKVAIAVEVTVPLFGGPFRPEDPDLFDIELRLRPETRTDDALEVVQRALGRLVTDADVAESLRLARTRLELAWNTAIERLVLRATALSGYGALVGDPDELADDLVRLMSVTANDIRRVTDAWLLHQPRAIVDARPAPQAVRVADAPLPPLPPTPSRMRQAACPAIEASPPRTMTLIARFSLANGLHVRYVRHTQLPLLEVRLIIPGGRAAERGGEKGLAMAASELLLAGAGDQDARTLAATLASLGWTMKVRDDIEHVSITAVGLARHAPAFFQLLGTVLSSASYPEPEVAVWRETRIHSRHVKRHRPDNMAVERLRQALFGSHAYGRPAPDDALMAAVASERVAAWRRRAIVPAGAALVLVGDGDAADLRETLEHAFASWQGAPDAIDVPAMPVMTARQPRIAIVDRPGSSQACLVIGQAVHLTPNDRDFLAFTVLNQLLGGSSTSRLFVNIRSEHGYTYGAYSRAMAMSRGLLWSAHAQVRHDVAAPALAAMRAEIARVREESIPEETLTALAHYLAGRFLLTCAALDGCADVLAAYEIHRQHAEDEQRTYLARLEALTTADIGRVAREHLDPDAMVVVAVGDAASLASQWPDA